MTEIIQKLEDFVLKSMNLSISKLEKDLECDECVVIISMLMSFL